MSSLYVRDKIKEFITTNLPDESVVDLTGEIYSLENLLAQSGIVGRVPWLGLQFVGSEEIPIALTASNNTGKYREIGAIYIHIVEVSRLNVYVPILQRAELVRDAFRGQRIEDILIESVTPANFSTGATLNFEGGYTSASVILSYERDLNL